MADPQAVVVTNACAEAFDRVGMPEGRYHLAQAVLYLATAPKSNSIMGFFDALAAVEGITVPKRENCTLRLKAFLHKHLSHPFFNNTRK
ncbi:MAG: hypothetical protein RMZ43_019315 [Nostoc sp. CmiVER01]